MRRLLDLTTQPASAANPKGNKRDDTMAKKPVGTKAPRSGEAIENGTIVATDSSKHNSNNRNVAGSRCSTQCCTKRATAVVTPATTINSKATKRRRPWLEIVDDDDDDDDDDGNEEKKDNDADGNTSLSSNSDTVPTQESIVPSPLLDDGLVGSCRHTRIDNCSRAHDGSGFSCDEVIACSEGSAANNSTASREEEESLAGEEYLEVQTLGGGAFGLVVKAVAQSTGKEVALKCLRRNKSGELPIEEIRIHSR